MLIRKRRRRRERRREIQCSRMKGLKLRKKKESRRAKLRLLAKMSLELISEEDVTMVRNQMISNLITIMLEPRSSETTEVILLTSNLYYHA
jgi:hypothetical protein